MTRSGLKNSRTVQEQGASEEPPEHTPMVCEEAPQRATQLLGRAGILKATSRRSVFYGLLLVAMAGFFLAPYLVFFIAEPMSDFIQKIFYFHVPCAWSMFLSAFVCAVGSVAYLFRSRRWGDELCAAGAELTVVYGLLVLITGPLWAKQAWGHYWVWDARLTTVFVLFLIYVAVLLARKYGGPMRQKIAAGLALFGAADVPLVYVSVKLWRTIHPETTVVGSLQPGMRLAFLTSLVVFTVLFICLLAIRVQLERNRHLLDELAVSIAERE
jgi:heme exporter protein C